jgi:hypothetical protein
MKPAGSIDLSNYRVFINEVAYIKNLIKQSSHKEPKMKLDQLSTTLAYLEERIAEIGSRIQ